MSEPLADLDKIALWLRDVASGRRGDLGLFASPAVREAMEREAHTCDMAATDIENALERLRRRDTARGGSSRIPQGGAYKKAHNP